MDKTVIDLFSGVGGFSFGFEAAGYKVIVANEYDKNISKSYSFNKPHVKMFNMPIQEFCKLDIPKAEVVIGGPPCQGFSMAGKRSRPDYTGDERNDLFNYYLKVVKKAEPKMIVMENVPGIVTMNHGKILDEIETQLSKMNYQTAWRILDSSNFGVPQKRKRFILIGSKNLTKEQIETNYSNFVENNSNNNNTSVRDAIGDLVNCSDTDEDESYLTDAGSLYQKMMREGSKKLYNHIKTNHSKVAIDRMKQVKQGKGKECINAEIKSKHSGSYYRMEWDSPARTIITRFDTPSGGPYTHPIKNRTITPREAARLQSFPDKFIFKGPKSSIIKQVGNAVPPLLSMAIAEEIKGW